MTPPVSRAARLRLLTAALGFAEIHWRYRPEPASALDGYLYSWTGLGDVLVGMAAQGFDVELRHLGDQWRAVQRAPWRVLAVAHQ